MTAGSIGTKQWPCSHWRAIIEDSMPVLNEPTAASSSSIAQRPPSRAISEDARSQRAIKKLSSTAPRKDDEREPDKRPLDLALIVRLIGSMRPYAIKRNWRFAMVIVLSIQLPPVAW